MFEPVDMPGRAGSVKVAASTATSTKLVLPPPAWKPLFGFGVTEISLFGTAGPLVRSTTNLIEASSLNAAQRATGCAAQAVVLVAICSHAWMNRVCAPSGRPSSTELGTVPHRDTTPPPPGAALEVGGPERPGGDDTGVQAAGVGSRLP